VYLHCIVYIESISTKFIKYLNLLFCVSLITKTTIPNLSSYVHVYILYMLAQQDEQTMHDVTNNQ
jgi:hypothetical protein